MMPEIKYRRRNGYTASIGIMAIKTLAAFKDLLESRKKRIRRVRRRLQTDHLSEDHDPHKGVPRPKFPPVFGQGIGHGNKGRDGYQDRNRAGDPRQCRVDRSLPAPSIAAAS
jgi:hypothetical protein